MLAQVVDAADGDLDGVLHVVGVDEQRRVLAERVDLRGERGALVVVQQRERVRRRARRRHVVATSRLEVGGGREPRDVRGARGCDRCLLVRATRAHLDARTAVGGEHHARRSGGDG